MTTIARETITRIRTEEDYEVALDRFWEIFHVEFGTPEFDEHELLADLIELYEQRHYPMGSGNSISMIEFTMDQKELTTDDLIPFVGSRTKVLEVLSGERQITPTMARALHKELNIPVQFLLPTPNAPIENPLSGMDPHKFPLSAMAKRGWIFDVPDSEMDYYAEELIRILTKRADALYLPVDPPDLIERMEPDTDRYALAAWRWQALALASERRLGTLYDPGTVTPDFLRRVVKLSASEDGPRLAEKLLAEHGIPLIILPHLPGAPLDGAALRSADRRPVIALTLRHDRIDNFWFCLLHEIAHVALHIDTGDDALIDSEGDIFIHNHNLRRGEVTGENSKESQADRLAEEALIPNSAWEESDAYRNPTPFNVMSLAQDLGVHPAIVAGRVRYQRGNYRLLSQFVGSGQVRNQFDRPL